MSPALERYTSTATFHELDRDVRSMPKSVSNDSISDTVLL